MPKIGFVATVNFSAVFTARQRDVLRFTVRYNLSNKKQKSINNSLIRTAEYYLVSKTGASHERQHSVR